MTVCLKFDFNYGDNHCKVPYPRMHQRVQCGWELNLDYVIMITWSP